MRAEPNSRDVFPSDHRKVDAVVVSQVLKLCRDKRNNGEGVKKFTHTMFQYRWSRERYPLKRR